MKEIVEWLKGKKTYFIAATIGIVAALQYLGVEIPEWVYALLAALGLGSLRAGVNNTTKVLLMCLILFAAGCGNVWMSTAYKQEVTKADIAAKELLVRCEAGDCEACKGGLQKTVETLDLILEGAK